MNRVVFLPKPLDEDVVRTFDFTSLLGEGVTLAAAVVDAEVYSGDDPTPSDILSGDVQLDGPRVHQRFTGGELGTVYTTTCIIGTCDDEVLSLAAYLSISEAADE